MEPTNKAPAIDAILSSFTGKDRKDMIRNRQCMTCGGCAYYFRDDLSKKEYAISGMCQSCQDDFFGVTEEA